MGRISEYAHLCAVLMGCWAIGGGALPSHAQPTAARTKHEAASAKRLGSDAEPRYLLFWGSPEQVPDLVRKIGTKGDGRTRLLGFGQPCPTFQVEKQVPALVHACFEAARKHNVAVMLMFDLHIAWQNRPDLWNWFDPSKPGYDPANKANVEWFGWNGQPAKVRYLDNGITERFAPPPCFTSKRLRHEWTRLVRQVVAPAILRELSVLKREGKERLFAGVLVGNEPMYDNYAHAGPEMATMIADDGSPSGQLGYRSLLDRGFSKNHPPAHIHEALGAIIQETVAFWCRQFADAGISPSRLYTHVPAQPPLELMSVPISAAFNKWARPGWTTYPIMQLEKGFQPLYRELHAHANPPWGGVEANVGFPGSAVDWETYLAWHYNHGAVVVGVNTQGSGKDLPDRLEKSAFGPDALAAYRKFLHGNKLKETPASERPEARLRRTMSVFQARIREWQASGRDPSPVARDVEERLTPLLQAGKLTEAVSVLNGAIQRLPGTGTVPAKRTTHNPGRQRQRAVRP